MKKLAFISEHASPLAVVGGVDSGGQNVYVAELSIHLAQLGYEIDIYTRKENKEAPLVVHWHPNIKVIHISAGPETPIPKEQLLGYMEAFTSQMIRYITTHHLHYDLIHAHFFMSGLVASRLKKRLDIPYVITFHALGRVRMLHQKEKDAFPVERLDIEQFLMQDADGVIAECPQDRQDMIEHYEANPAKITIIPCGFNPAEFYPLDKTVARKRLQLKPTDLILLQLGRMVPRKGIDNVIRAMAQLTDIPHIKLLVVGGASEVPDFKKEPELRRLAHIAKVEKVSTNVIFTGRRVRSELKYYYSAADFFISTPWYEPFGITPLEAMACGTPVVGSNVGGIKYSVKSNHTGFLVPPHDPIALAQAVRKGITDRRLYDQLCQNAIDRVNGLFTWEKVASKAHKLYQSLVAVYVPKNTQEYAPKGLLPKNHPTTERTLFA